MNALDTLAATVNTQWLGYLAATLTTGAFVPQALHTFRSSDLAGISLGLAYGIFTVFAVLSIPFVARYIRETKGVSLEDMGELEGARAAA